MGTTYQILIPFLTFVSVLSIGGALLAARAARREPVQARLRGLMTRREGSDARESKGDGGMRGVLARIGTLGFWGRPSAGLQQMLAQAGYHGASAAGLYLGAKVLLLMTGLVLAAAVLLPLDISLPVKMLVILGAATLMSFIPNALVLGRRRRRRSDVRRQLPDALDLLEICVSSGMGLDMAWNSVADEIRRVSATLADEMALADLEIHLGAARAAAMRHMAERTGADELASLVAMLIQSERFGTSIADALRVFAKSMRETRSQRAEEAAEKTTVKLLFPMILFIFPAVFVVAVGPAGLKLVELFGAG